MPRFPSEAWCAAAVDAIHAEPEAAIAGRGFDGEVACVVDEPGFFAAWAHVEGGRIRSWRVLSGPEELERLAPAYRARASLETWRGLLGRTIDPVEAVLDKRLRVVGALAPLVERLRYKGLAGRVLDRVLTSFDG